MEIRKPDAKEYFAALQAAEDFEDCVREVLKGVDVPTIRIDIELFAFSYATNGKPMQGLTIHDTEEDHRTRLANMISIGKMFGVSKWKRNFSTYTGNFSYEADVEGLFHNIHFKHNNASQGKCTIIKKTEMVEKVTYTADCGGQIDAEISAMPEANLDE